jgi:hypothetical protein
MQLTGTKDRPKQGQLIYQVRGGLENVFVGVDNILEGLLQDYAEAVGDALTVVDARAVGAKKLLVFIEAVLELGRGRTTLLLEFWVVSLNGSSAGVGSKVL